MNVGTGTTNYASPMPVSDLRNLRKYVAWPNARLADPSLRKHRLLTRFASLRFIEWQISGRTSNATRSALA